MATQLSELISRIRSRHAAFHWTRVPDLVLAEALSDKQRQLFVRGAEIHASELAVACAIAFATGGQNVPGAVGAGSAGGLPVAPGTNPNTLTVPGGSTGASVEVVVDGAPVLLNDTVVSAADAVSVTLAGVALTVNALAGQLVVITAGTGSGSLSPGIWQPRQVREIISNTATKLVISTGSDGLQWTQIPDTTSMARVVELQLAVDEATSVVTSLPPKLLQTGYLVQIDANGRPYINLATPMAVPLDAGIPLPPYSKVIGGSIYYVSTQGLSPLNAKLTIHTYENRFLWGPTATCYLEGGKLFLMGDMSDWQNVTSLDIRLVPIPTDFAARTDYMLLPDIAKPAMLAAGAAAAAHRAATDPTAPPVDTAYFDKQEEKADEAFLTAIGSSLQKSYVREVY